jgi:hypothetical protein
VIEPSAALQRRVERVLARMAERRVADIVGQAQGLGQILVEPERAGDHPADLRHLQAVGQADAVMIAVGRDEDLGLVTQPAERDRMDDPVAVTLISAARPPRERAFQRELAPTGKPRVAGERGAGQDRASFFRGAWLTPP